MWQRELCRECEALRCQGAETQEPATLFKEMVVGGVCWWGVATYCSGSPCVFLAQLKASLLLLLIKSGCDFPQLGCILKEAAGMKRR